MLKTRDKALISLTALFQAALGIFGFLRMLVRKEIFYNENDFPAAVSTLVLLFVVTFAFAVIMRDLPSKTYVIPAFSMPMIFLIAGFLGVGADFDAAGDGRRHSFRDYFCGRHGRYCNIRAMHGI